jgi:hypothetical protein
MEKILGDAPVLMAIIGYAVQMIVVVVGFFLVRTLTKIDRNQVELFQRITSIERDFYELRGEHKARRDC